MLGGMFLSTPFVYQLKARPTLADVVQLSVTIATIPPIATNPAMKSPGGLLWMRLIMNLMLLRYPMM